MNIEEFYIYDSVRDQWLQNDERSFGAFDGRAVFSSRGDPQLDARSLAEDIAKREARGRTGLIVLGHKAR